MDRFMGTTRNGNADSAAHACALELRKGAGWNGADSGLLRLATAIPELRKRDAASRHTSAADSKRRPSLFSRVLASCSTSGGSRELVYDLCDSCGVMLSVSNSTPRSTCSSVENPMR